MAMLAAFPGSWKKKGAGKQRKLQQPGPHPDQENAGVDPSRSCRSLSSSAGSKRLVKVLSWPLRQSRALLSLDSQHDDAESSDDEDGTGVLGAITSWVENPQDGATLARQASLFETCATVILNSVELTTQLEVATPFKVSDLFTLLGPARARVKSKLESSALSLRGNCMPISQLCTTIQMQASKLACLGKLNLDRVSAMSDKVITNFLLDGQGKPLLPTVKYFSMDDNAGVTDAGVKKLLLTYGPHLHGISINNTACTHKCVKVMARVNPNLQSVGLAYMTHMRDRHIQQLVKGCKKITELDLSYCLLLSDEAMQALPGIFHLQTLSVAYNPNIGKGVEALSRNPFLRSLRLQNCHRVNSRALSSVVRSCALLDSLCIRGCPMMSLDVIRSCADNCVHLRALDVGACPQINGNKALGILARSATTRKSLKEFMSTQRVIMHASPRIMDLYANELPAEGLHFS